MRPTSRDVAQAAGVSQSTVSIVLAGKWPGRISPATARAVRDAADRLGYRPNAAARNLRLGHTRTILLVVPTLANPFFGELFTGAARAAAERGFGVVVYPAGQGDPPYDAIDGVIVSSLGAVANLPDVPRVLIDSDPARPDTTVNLDVAGGMREIVAHLAGLGHRRIAHVAADVGEWTFGARTAALARAVRDLPGGALVRAETTIDVRSADAAARGLLRRSPRPTALVCDDDLIAAGAYRAVRAAGLSIPGDVSVTGFDDVQVAEILDPELTTIRLPAGTLGDHAVRALLAAMEGIPGEDGPPADAVSLPGELVVRGSTAPPPS